MPYKGSRKLPDKQRVEMLLAKELKPNGSDTNRTLAEQFDVAEITVRKAKYENLTEVQKDLYNKLRAELKDEALYGASLALKKGQELVSQADSPRDLAGVTSYGKFAHDVYRLETNQSTSNIVVKGQIEMFIEDLKGLGWGEDRIAIALREAQRLPEERFVVADEMEAKLAKID